MRILKISFASVSIWGKYNKKIINAVCKPRQFILHPFPLLVMDYNNAIYKYVEYLFKKSGSSKRKFAKDHFMEDSTVRDILNKGDYQISLITIFRICEGENTTPSAFFKEVEKMFPEAKI